MNRLRSLARKKESAEEAVNGYTQLSAAQNGSSHVLPPVPVASSSSDGMEGFICPTCHAKFVVMDELLGHVPVCRGPGSVATTAVGSPAVFPSATNKTVFPSAASPDSDELLLKLNGFEAMKEGNEILRQELRASHQQQQSLNEHLERLKIENDELLKKLSVQERRMSTAKASEDDRQFQKLAAERSSNQAEILQLQSKIHNLENQKVSLETAIAEGRKSSEKSTAKFDGDLQSLKSIIDGHKATITQLQNDTSTADSTQKALSDSKGEVSRLRVQVESVRQSFRELEARNETLATEVRDLQSSLEKKEHELKLQVAENVALSHAKSDTTGVVEELQLQIASLMSKLDHERSAAENFSGQLRGRDRDIEIQKDSVVHLEKELQITQASGERVKLECEELRTKLNSEVDRRLAAVAELGQAELEKKTLQENYAAVIVRLDESQAELSTLRAQMEGLTSKIEGNEAATVLISQLSADKESLEKQLVEKELRYDGLLKAERENRNQAVTESQLSREKVDSLQRIYDEEKEVAKIASENRDTLERSLKDEIGVLTEKLKKSKEDFDAKCAMYDSVEKEMLSLREEVELKSAQKIQLTSRVKSLEALSTELEQKSVSLGSGNDELSEQIARLSMEKESLQQSKADLKTQIVTLHNREENLTSDIRTMQEASERALQETRRLTALIDAAGLHEDEFKAKVATLESRVLESEETIKKERKNIDDLRNNLAATEALLKSSQASLEDLSLEKISLLAAVKEKDAKIATFDRESAAVKEDLRLLASVKDEMARNADIKATVTENLMHDLETARKESVVLENAFAELKVQLDTLREQKDAELSAAALIAEFLQESLTSLQLQVAAAHESSNDSTQKVSDLQKQLDYAIEQKGTLQDGILKMQELKDLAENHAKTIQHKLQQLEATSSELGGKLNSSEERIAQLAANIFDGEQLRSELSRKMEESSAVWEQKYRKLENSLAESEREKFQIGKNLQETKQSAADLEERISVLTSELGTAKTEAQTLTETLREKQGIFDAEQSRLAQSLAVKESACANSVRDAELKLEKSAKTVEKYAARAKELESLRETAERNLFQLQNERSSTALRISQLEDESRVALTRCIELEDQKDKLQNSIGEIRRKYEDSVAAMHELGRENQTLQVECTRLKTRKWAVDEETNDCAACGKTFGLTQRKHHCRQCGEIFCQECSAKTASIVAAKKPVRVCDSCFVEIQGRS